MSSSPFVTRVVLLNYKSIASCDVRLGPLTILVGPNGSGKSNFLDALRFVADALRTSLDHALRERGGVQEVRRRSHTRPAHPWIRIDFRLPDGRSGHYAFGIGARSQGGFRVQGEECEVEPSGGGYVARFRVDGDRVETTARVAPSPSDDRLYLVAASGLPEFRDMFDALSRMGFYNLNPDRIRDLQSPDTSVLLARDGSNLASVLARMNPDVKARVEEYLGKVVPGLTGVRRYELGPKETLEFQQEAVDATRPWHFYASNMSDGTLRALGVLVALFQSADDGSRGGVPLVGIEEPEAALHPRAAGVLLDALREASASTQVLVTSHSPDLLDDKDIDSDSLLAVGADGGETHIGPIDDAGRSAMREHLYTAGELLRLDQVKPDLP